MTIVTDSLVRFTDLLNFLPNFDGPIVLDLGCGNADCLSVVNSHYRNAVCFGLDRVLVDLHQVGDWVYPVQADIRAMPFRLDVFDLVISRHPDLIRNRETWRTAFLSVHKLLKVSGWWLITCYTLPELEQTCDILESCPRLRWHTMQSDNHRLYPPDLVGHDRYAIFCRLM